MIVGVSDENETLLQDYIGKKGVEFGIVRAVGGLQMYGGRGYPTFVTIAPSGEVVEYGVPSTATIEEQLRQVVLVPQMPDDRAFQSLRRAWEKKKFEEVDRELARGLERNEAGSELHTTFTELRAKFDKLLASSEAAVERLAAGPDYGRSVQKLEAIVEEFGKLAPAVAAQKVLAQFEDDERIQGEIKAAKILDALLKKYDASKSSERQKLQKALAGFRQQYGETFAGKRSAEISTQLASGG